MLRHRRRIINRQPPSDDRDQASPDAMREVNPDLKKRDAIQSQIDSETMDRLAAEGVVYRQRGKNLAEAQREIGNCQPRVVVPHDGADEELNRHGDRGGDRQGHDLGDRDGLLGAKIFWRGPETRSHDAIRRHEAEDELRRAAVDDGQVALD